MKPARKSLILCLALQFIVCLQTASAVRIDNFDAEVVPDTFERAASKGKAEIFAQSSRWTDRWSNDPRCISVYLNAPSWMHYDISLKLQATVNGKVDEGVTKCVNEKVRWRTVVAGVDYLPRSLAVAVGYDDPLLTSTFSSTAAYDTDPLSLEEGDYADEPPPWDTTAVNDQILFQQVGLCFAKHSASLQTQAALAQRTQGQAQGSFAGISAQLLGDQLVARSNLSACLAAIQVPGLPPAPPPPPPAPPRSREQRGVRGFANRERREFDLAPFLRYPEHVSSKRPYRFRQANITDTSKVTYQTYVMPEEACPTAFGDPQFKTYSLDTEVQSFDSCYYTQTIAYINYPGDCLAERTTNLNLDIPFFTVEAQVAATYNSYTQCNNNAIFKLGLALRIVLIISIIPVALFMMYLFWPTIWRCLCLVGYMLGGWLFLPKSAKQRRAFQRAVGTPLRWAWLQRLYSLPLVTAIAMLRKKFVYAIITIQFPNGRNRLVQVLAVAAVTNFVSLVVWRPGTRIVLHSNPTTVTLQLDEVQGPYGKLARYFQIAGISLFMGCLAYMSLLTNGNLPERDDVDKRTNDLKDHDLQMAMERAKKGAVPHNAADLNMHLTAQDHQSAAFPARKAHVPGTSPSVLAGMATPNPGNARRAGYMVDQYNPSDGASGTNSGSDDYYDMLNRTHQPQELGMVDDMQLVQVGDHIATRDRNGKLTRLVINLSERSTYWTPWQIQKRLTIIFTAFLVFLLTCQIVNLAVLMPIVQSKAAYVWMIGVQGVLIVCLIVAQICDLLTCDHYAAVKYLGDAVPKPHGFTGALIWLYEKFADKPRLTPTTMNAGDDAGLSKSISTRTNKVDFEVVTKDDVKRNKWKNVLLRAWRGEEWYLREKKPGMRMKEYKRMKLIMQMRERRYTLGQQIKMIWTESFAEETFTVDKKDGTCIRVKSFKYPAWFLSSVLTAAIMLVFHYIKSLDFAEMFGNCVVSWSECEIGWIRRLANTYSLEQFGMLRSGALRLMRQIDQMRGSEIIINRLLAGVGSNMTVFSIYAKLERLNWLLTPGNGKRAIWVEEFGKQLGKTSTLGYTAGLLVGIVTLITAIASFKRTSKMYRQSVIVRRILAARTRAAQKAKCDRDDDDNDDDDNHDADDDMDNLDITATTTTFMFTNNTHTIRNMAKSIRTKKKRAAPSDVTGTIRHKQGGTPKKAVAGANDDNNKNSKAANVKKPFDVHGVKDTAWYDDDDEEDDDFDQDAPIAEPEAYNHANIASVRAFSVPFTQVVFFLGVLLSATVVQLYSVGIVLSAIFAFVLSNYFWTVIFAKYWPYVVMAVVVMLLNKVIMTKFIGDRYISNGHSILRPAGWFAFLIIGSITNLILGLFIAIIRLVVLLISAIFTVGLLDRSLMVIFAKADASYNSFLAGIQLRDAGDKVDVRSFRPGSNWRAVRRWTAAADILRRLKAKGFRKLVERNERAAGMAPPSASPGPAPGHNQGLGPAGGSMPPTQSSYTPATVQQPWYPAHQPGGMSPHHTPDYRGTAGVPPSFTPTRSTDALQTGLSSSSVASQHAVQIQLSPHMRRSSAGGSGGLLPLPTRPALGSVQRSCGAGDVSSVQLGPLQRSYNPQAQQSYQQQQPQIHERMRLSSPGNSQSGVHMP